jgi:hypothetical protein
MIRKRPGFEIVLAILFGLVASPMWPATGAPLAPPPQTFVLEFAPIFLVKAPPSPVLDLGSQYSIEFWILPEDSGPAVVFMKEDQFEAYSFRMNSDGTFKFIQAVASGSQASVISPQVPPVRTWTHVAVTSDGTTLRLYVGGVDVAETPSLGTPPVDPTTQLQFSPLGHFALRELRIWNRALSVAEISQVATHSLSPQAGLMANWRFDETGVFVAHDSGPSHLNLQLIPGQPRPVHAAVLENGPFFSVEVTPATSLSGTGLSFGQGGLADYDGDGAPDLIISATKFTPESGPAGHIVVLHNDGKGHFEDRTTSVFTSSIPATVAVCCVVAGDFNGDGRQDVFIADIGEGRVIGGVPTWGAQNRLLLQTTAGKLTDVTSTNLPQANSYSYTARAADIDGSGHLDLYLGNIHFGPVSDPHGPLFLDNDGTGHFQFNETRLPAEFREPTFTGTVWSNGAFINARQRPVPDLVVCCSADSFVDGVIVSSTARDTLLLNDGTGHFTRAAAESMPSSVPPFATVFMETGDFDGDGWPDLIEYGLSDWHLFKDARLRLLLNNHDGTFREARWAIPVITNPAIENFWVTEFRVGDFNGDGHTDILLNSNGAGSILLLNRGAATFVDASDIIPIDFKAGGQVFAADLDGNGSLDLVTAAFGQSIAVARQLKPASLGLFNSALKRRRAVVHN